MCVMVGLGGVGSQLELQEVEPHNGLSTSICQDCCRLLKAMVGATWTGTHTCDDETECVLCESCVMWYQLALKLVKFLSPEEPAEPPDVSVALVWMRFQMNFRTYLRKVKLEQASGQLLCVAAAAGTVRYRIVYLCRLCLAF